MGSVPGKVTPFFAQSSLTILDLLLEPSVNDENFSCESCFRIGSWRSSFALGTAPWQIFSIFLAC